MHKRNGTGFNWEQFHLSVNNNVAWWVAAGGARTPLNSNGTIPAGIWTHVAVTYTSDAGNNSAQRGWQRIYINGVLDIQNEVNLNIQPWTEELFIGREPHWGNTWYGGQVTELRVWKIERTQSQIQATMNNALTEGHPDLVLRYDFVESGPNATDRTGNGHTAIPSSSAPSFNGPGDLILDGQVGLSEGIRSQASYSLDGEFSGAFPSGDGAPGGDFTADFTLGERPGSDFNGDERSDILFRHPSSGDVYLWLMNGLAVGGR